ncbi:DUF4910 domain-containing protein [Geomonas sp. Red32]|uniref:DUF4910 domain-containing protein n=1 Tax=Geomonas sp. Red32 TaxID=2912856 RepID=UPI00202D01A7|nr:DUF4910 domain-containing protein [Geomonas sp. Red32]MCM0083331.1 DUF4910 domain-containing protein [Geomonas sp. Red32]
MSRRYLDIAVDRGEAGEWMHTLVKELYPICRSITGDGFRRSLQILGERIPLSVREVASGTPVFDWTVPREWNVREAWVKDPAGRTVVDFRDSNLHLVSYSVPVRGKFSLPALREHLHTLPEHPGWIPYRTSYYREGWGFCLPHRTLESLTEGEYEVLIDSSLEKGALTYGELLLPGELEEEVLVSAHLCHPSLANDNLSGVSLAARLARDAMESRCRFSYRFLFIPGTIGAIAWLSLNEERVAKIRHGVVLSGVGDGGKFSYKRSRRGNAEIDRAACHALAATGDPFGILDFHPYGYDERQYCSPAFNLPVGRISRTPFGEYPQYHTSADDLSFVTAGQLADSLEKTLAILKVVENNGRFVNLAPKGEPQLGRRGIYSSPEQNEALLWVLNLSDGCHTLLDIAEKARLPFDRVSGAAALLAEHGLLREEKEPTCPSDSAARLSW